MWRYNCTMRVLRISVVVFVLVGQVAFAADIYTSNGMQITFYVPHNAPNCARSIEGCIATSRPGLDGKNIPRSLDDVRAGRAKYVTLASCPNNYNKFYHLGTITYKSAEDGQMHKVENVIGYVHDTGGDFPNGFNRKGVHGCKKLDVNTTICYKCTSDAQAGALASGYNVSFVPNGLGVADPTAFYSASFPGLYSSYGGLGYTNTAPVGTAYSNLTPSSLTPSKKNATPLLSASMPQSSMLFISPSDALSTSNAESQSRIVSELLLALTAPTSSVGTLSVRAPLTFTERIGSENASGLSAENAPNTSSGVSPQDATAPQSANTFPSSYRSPDLRWGAPTLFQHFFAQVEMILRSIIDLLKRL